MKNQKVLAVVVTFNRKALLVECIDSLNHQTYNCDILIVDNASTDGTFEAIEHYIDDNKIQYRNTGANLGGAGGFNFAFKEAMKDDYDYVWVMDDDTIPHKDALEKLLMATSEIPQPFGFLASYVEFTDGTPCQMNIPGVTKFKWIEGWTYSKDLIKVDRATFVSLLIPTAIIAQKGLPIKEFFIWADDSEYTKRITKDYPSYLVNSSVVTHKMKVNANTSIKSFLNEDGDRVDRYFYSYRNRFYIAKREGAISIFKYLLKSIATAFLALIKSKHYRFKKFAIVFKGLLSGLFFNPKIEFTTTQSMEKSYE